MIKAICLLLMCLICVDACGYDRIVNLKVSCADEPQQARLYVNYGKRGTIVFFSGSYGTSLWSKSTAARNALADLNEAGYATVEVRWRNGWLVGESGQAILACRPAKVLEYIRKRTRGAFCATGNSGGAAQVAYAMSRYSIHFDAVVLSGGPPMSRIDLGCLSNDTQLNYGRGPRHTIDSGWPGTPCQNHDESMREVFRDASIDDGGTYYFPRTRITFVLGAKDYSATGQAELYIAKLAEAGTTYALDVVENVGHRTHTFDAGAKAIYQALVQECR